MYNERIEYIQICDVRKYRQNSFFDRRPPIFNECIL